MNEKFSSKRASFRINRAFPLVASVLRQRNKNDSHRITVLEQEAFSYYETNHIKHGDITSKTTVVKISNEKWWICSCLISLIESWVTS
jgi:hypothetical protein